MPGARCTGGGKGTETVWGILVEICLIISTEIRCLKIKSVSGTMSLKYHFGKFVNKKKLGADEQ